MSGQPELSVATSARELSPDSALLLLLFDDGFDETLSALGVPGLGRLKQLAERGALHSKLYETSLVYIGDDEGPAVVCGAGSRDTVDGMTLMRVVAAGVRTAVKHKFFRIATVAVQAMHNAEFAAAASEGAFVGAYSGDLLKSSREPEHGLESLVLVANETSPSLVEALRTGQILGESRNLCRDLVNAPPNKMTPSVMADRAAELAAQYRLECTVMDEEAIRSAGMGSLLSVAAGSAEPPRVIMLRHGDGDAKLSFVGKGLTFDSGGLTLKPREGMETMKSDMAGAAAVIAGLVAVSRLGIADCSIVGYAGATENMPGPAAMRLGDVINGVNGKTIEVVNADAEGRLVLSDLLAYAERQGASRIVDLATLTGGAVVALGRAATLATGRPMSFVQRVVESADAGRERAWAMPLYPEYRRALKSNVADLKNSAGRDASALIAAAFLSEFVDRAEWAHLDIAGTAYSKDGSPYAAPGATGEGVGTIVELARREARGDL